MPISPIIKKSNLDQFYTKTDIAELCFTEVKKYSTSNSVFLEPATGDGSFYNILPENKIGYEIDENCSLSEVIIQDFLTVENLNILPEKIIVIGNPPFGSRNNLTNKFIKKSIELGNIIAFILPNVYRKETMQKVFPDNFSLVEIIDLPDNCFLLDGKEYHVPCCFQIWIKEHPINLRESIKEKKSTEDFKFDNNGKYFIFGAAPSKIILRELVNKNNRGYYFNVKDDTIIEQIKSINWNKHALSSVNGNVSWFTKQMIIEVYCESFRI